jgi:hypothetical protein
MDLERLVTTYGPFAFPIVFAAMWLAITTFFGLLSGWYGLADTYPDRDDPAILRMDFQSGIMGRGVSLHGVLRVEACAWGLRFGILRIFGPFSRDFFVPWTEVTVTRRIIFLRQMAELRFGGRGFQTINLPRHLADRLALAVPGRWPEPQMPPPESKSQILRSVFLQWLATTTLASAFFIIVPRLLNYGVTGPPISVAIIFPAVVFGLGALFQAFRRLTD